MIETLLPLSILLQTGEVPPELIDAIIQAIISAILSVLAGL